MNKIIQIGDVKFILYNFNFPKSTQKDNQTTRIPIPKNNENFITKYVKKSFSEMRSKTCKKCGGIIKK